MSYRICLTLLMVVFFLNPCPAVFENIMENGAFALLEQMLHFP